MASASTRQMSAGAAAEPEVASVWQSFKLRSNEWIARVSAYLTPGAYGVERISALRFVTSAGRTSPWFGKVGGGAKVASTPGNRVTSFVGAVGGSYKDGWKYTMRFRSCVVPMMRLSVPLPPPELLGASGGSGGVDGDSDGAASIIAPGSAAGTLFALHPKKEARAAAALVSSLLVPLSLAKEALLATSTLERADKCYPTDAVYWLYQDVSPSGIGIRDDPSYPGTRSSSEDPVRDGETIVVSERITKSVNVNKQGQEIPPQVRVHVLCLLLT